MRTEKDHSIVLEWASLETIFKSLHTSLVAHQAGAPGFSSMKRLGVFLLPPGWDASPSQGYLQHQIRRYHLYTWVERGTVRVKCLAQEHNTMSPARARTRSARSGVERTNHEATAPPLTGDHSTQEITAPPAASKIEKLSLSKDYHQIIFDLETSRRGN